MREPGLALTALAECQNPTCKALVYAELTSGPAAGFLLCVGCEESHAPRLREAVADPLFARSGGRLSARRHCEGPCCGGA